VVINGTPRASTSLTVTIAVIASQQGARQGVRNDITEP